MMFEIKRSISLALAKGGFDAIGIDTWGVDFGLLDRRGNLMQNPVHYRDPHTVGVPEQVFKIIPKRRFTKKPGFSSCASTPCTNYIIWRGRSLLCWPKPIDFF